MDEINGLIFGIYPFANAGMANGVATGKPDDFNKIGASIIELSAETPEFLVRTYAHFTGNNGSDVLRQIEQLLQIPVDWDLVLCFRSPDSDLKSWLELIRAILTRHGDRLNTLQITNEANLKNMPGVGDGYFPAASKALVQGVIAARDTVTKTAGITKIGFDAVPAFHAGDNFWTELKSLGGREFAGELDYVGLNLYPDVFGDPVALENIPTAVRQILKNFRREDMTAAGIPDSTPIRITENGWPTNSGRSYQRQAEVLESVVRTIYALRNELNITHYELFGLRDADSSNENMFHQFGILRDDHTPKPAYTVYQKLVRELGRK
ncbi:MAG: hypothetical protein ABJA02_01335 [Acidobacteriota bacterium]